MAFFVKMQGDAEKEGREVDGQEREVVAGISKLLAIFKKQNERIILIPFDYDNFDIFSLI